MRLEGYQLNPELWRRWTTNEDGYRDRTLLAIAPRVNTLKDAADLLLPYLADPIWSDDDGS